ncbi:MAG: hypothetical protein HYU53_10385 [Acidobacteria bacterium]|nr:hypothetical protein [Acidobacteriota bacterium]
MHRVTWKVPGLVAACVLLMIPAVAAGQESWPPPEAAAPEPLSINCGGGVYSVGAGATLFSLCVSDHGNMVSLMYPNGAEHIAVAPIHESYSICHGPGSGIWYYDWASFEGGFGPPIFLDPAPFPVIIRRTTLDGKVILDQKFTPNKARREMLISMTIRNNSPAALENVLVARNVDADMDGDALDDTFDRSTDQTWARDIRSLVLSAHTVGTPHSTAVPVTIGSGPCSSTTAVTPTSPGTDYHMRIWYTLGTIGVGKSKTVMFRYNGS